MPWYTTADARKDAERQGAQKEKTMKSQLPEPLCNLPKYCQDAIIKYAAEARPVIPAQKLHRPCHELAWLHSHCRSIGMIEKSLSGKLAHDIALFAAQLQERNKQLQSQKKPLTDQEIDSVAEFAYGFASKNAEFRTRFVRAVERAHGIVND